MKKHSNPSVPRYHPQILMSRLKVRISFFVWLLMAVLAVFVYFHGGQFGGMTGTVITLFDDAAPLEAGRLKAVYVRIGDTVTADAPLAQMDTALLAAEKAVFEAEAAAQQKELAALTDEVARLEPLLKQGLIREQDVLSLRVKQKALQATGDAAASTIAGNIRLLDLRIQNCTLRAQAAGVVSRIYHSAGNIVQGGDPVVSVVIDGKPSVVGFLSEYNARDVSTGMSAYLSPVSGHGAFFRAKVVALTPEVFSQPGRVNPVPSQQSRGRRVVFEPEPGCNLLPGEEVQISFQRPWTFQVFGNLLKNKASR